MEPNEDVGFHFMHQFPIPHSPHSQKATDFWFASKVTSTPPILMLENFVVLQQIQINQDRQTIKTFLG